MNSISPNVAKLFCDTCNWAYECWYTHKRLFEGEENIFGKINGAKGFGERLSYITQEYVLLQICKLHDPAIQQGRINLSIDYFVRFGEWGTEKNLVEDYRNSLQELFEKLFPARNRIIAHNDLETLCEGKSLGSFQQDLDVEYFKNLQELVNKIHEKWCKGPFLFCPSVKGDVEEFGTLTSRK